MGSVQLGDGEPGASVSTTGTHAAQFSTNLRAIPDAAVFSATWAGKGERGNLSDPANWVCRNNGGIVLEDKLPGERIYAQSAWAMSDEEKRTSELKPFSLTGDSFRKIVIREDVVRK